MSHGENTVGIDPAGLAAEAAGLEVPAELEAAAPVADGAAPEAGGEGAPVAGELSEAQAAEIAARHRPMVGVLVNTLADTLVPAWAITGEERGALTESLSVALAHWWPDGSIPPKWAALAGVVYTGYSIANARRNADGSWKPRKVVTVKRAASGEAPAAPITGNPVGTGGFSTSA